MARRKPHADGPAFRLVVVLNHATPGLAEGRAFSLFHAALFHAALFHAARAIEDRAPAAIRESPLMATMALRKTPIFGKKSAKHKRSIHNGERPR